MLKLEHEDKKKIMDNLNEVVDFVSEVAVKSLSFATFYILKMLDYDDDKEIAEQIIDDYEDDRAISVTDHDDENVELMSIDTYHTNDLYDNNVPTTSKDSLRNMPNTVQTIVPTTSTTDFTSVTVVADVPSASTGPPPANNLENNNIPYIGNIIFSPPFFTACQQLDLNKNPDKNPIANKNEKLPKNRMFEKFNQFLQQFPNHGDCLLRPLKSGKHDITFAVSLQYLAIQSSTNTTNNVVETFERRFNQLINFDIKKNLELKQQQIKKLGRYILKLFNGDDPLWPKCCPETEALINFIDRFKVKYNAIFPINIKKMANEPGIYLKILYKHLQDIEKYSEEKITLYNDIQVEAAYSWCKHKIKEHPDYENWYRKKKSAIAFKTFQLINNNERKVQYNHRGVSDDAKNFLISFVNDTRSQIENSKKFLTAENPPDADKSICFRPAMDLTIKKVRLFALVPQYSLKRKYITINASTLRSIFVRSKIKHEYKEIDGGVNNIGNIKANTDFFTKVFDFSKLHINDCLNRLDQFSDTDNDDNDDNQRRRKPIFTNLIRTDGFGIDFIFSKQAHHNSLPRLDIEDFTLEEVNKYFHLVGADPGHIDIYNATDGQELFKYSSAEYYSKSGTTKIRHY
ncbi:unnamed protein product [Cunninghamella blakesleeana]